MRSFLKFLFIIFLEVSYGITVAFFTWLVLYFAFDKDSSIHGRIDEAIYYVVILVPPFIFCYMEYLKLKKKEADNGSKIYLFAGLTYLLGGFAFLLISTGFYLFGN